MSDETPARQTSKLPVIIALSIFVLITGLFAYELVISSAENGGIADESLTVDTYVSEVNALLLDADPVRGEALVEAKGCNACHAGPNAGRLAPPHAEVARVAAERRPPLTAGAYIYESILFPGALVVESYQNNMPRVYGDQLTEAELGDIIAYLLLNESGGE